MRELRSGIRQSFERIDSFLMPHPGLVVAEGEFTNGDLQQIDSKFIDYVQLLVPSIFAPENLIIKQINGQKVRARDLISYAQAYVSAFNSDSLPEPKSVLMVRLNFYNCEFRVFNRIPFTTLIDRQRRRQVIRYYTVNA